MIILYSVKSRNYVKVAGLQATTFSLSMQYTVIFFMDGCMIRIICKNISFLEEIKPESNAVVDD